MATPATAAPTRASSLLQLMMLAAPWNGAGEVDAGAPVVNVPLVVGTGTPVEYAVTTGAGAVVRTTAVEVGT